MKKTMAALVLMAGMLGVYAAPVNAYTLAREDGTMFTYDGAYHLVQEDGTAVTYVVVEDREEVPEIVWDEQLQPGIAVEAVEAGETTYTEAVEEGAYLAESEKRIQEYEKAGILYDKEKGWMWKGKPVRILLDDGGGFYSNGIDEAYQWKIYLYLERDEQGEISKVTEISGTELMKELAQQDLAKVETR